MKRILLFAALIIAVASVCAKEIRTVVFTTTPEMTCANSENKIKDCLQSDNGIQKIETRLAEQEIAITYDADKTSADAFIKSLSKIGYQAVIKTPKDTPGTELKQSATPECKFITGKEAECKVKAARLYNKESNALPCKNVDGKTCSVPVRSREIQAAKFAHNNKKGCNQQPCNKKPCDKQTCDKKACDKKPCDKKPCDKQTCDKKACDKKPCDKKACDKKACDKKACDKKPCDKKPCDKQTCDKKACDKK